MLINILQYQPKFHIYKDNKKITLMLIIIKYLNSLREEVMEK